MSLNLEKRDGVAIVTLDRPPVNALTLALYSEIADLFEKLGKELDVHCAIFTGAGNRAFCAGLDLNEFLSATPEQDPERAAIVRRTFSAVYRCPIPVIAAINGPALGAGSVLGDRVRHPHRVEQRAFRHTGNQCRTMRRRGSPRSVDPTRRAASYVFHGRTDRRSGSVQARTDR